MSYWTTFRNRGKLIWIVERQTGELDRQTGIRPTTYQFSRELALVGTKNLGFSSFIHLDESMIVLSKEADLVVIDRVAYTLTPHSSLGALKVYKIDKVKGNEYNIIVDEIPA